ncbi:MAG: AAA family ATPase [Saprospiraceae bacterium]
MLIVNAEDVRFNSVFSSQNLETMMNLIEDHETIFIDEAQSIQNIGINLKFSSDAKPNSKIIVTGSSSFEIANKIQEPLTGRVKNFFLFPLV